MADEGLCRYFVEVVVVERREAGGGDVLLIRWLVLLDEQLERGTPPLQ